MRFILRRKIPVKNSTPGNFQRHIRQTIARRRDDQARLGRLFNVVPATCSCIERNIVALRTLRACDRLVSGLYSVRLTFVVGLGLYLVSVVAVKSLSIPKSPKSLNFISQLSSNSWATVYWIAPGAAALQSWAMRNADLPILGPRPRPRPQNTCVVFSNIT